MNRRGGLLGAALFAAASSVALGAALAQPIDSRRPLTLRVGPPDGTSPTERVDPARRGLARALPSGPLHVAWRRSVGQSIESAPLSVAGGDLAVVAGRSELVIVGSEGDERSRISLGAVVAGPGTSTSDGTVVLVASSGDVIGVRSNAVRFRARVGERGAYARAAPLPLDDGGAVIATGTDLVAIDPRGFVRARASLPEVIAAAPIAARGRVAAVTTSGSVFTWMPGRDAERIGSFGGAIDGGAALSDPDTLVAVVDATRLVSLDLRHGSTTTRSQAVNGLLLGPPAAPPGALEILGLSPGRTALVGVRANGEETHRIALPGGIAAALPDGGVGALLSPPHVGPLADRAGAVAFATPDGHVGVVSAGGASEVLADLPCIRSFGVRSDAPPMSPPTTQGGPGGAAPATMSPPTMTGGMTGGVTGGVVGLVPVPGGIVVACDSGSLVKIVGT